MGYTNSPLVVYTKLSPNHSGQRTHSIDRITPHCVVGQRSVETLGSIFAPTSRQASCNYGIGVDGRVGMYVEEKNRSWCSSSNANDQRAITIECASDTTEPYAFKDVVYQTLIKLCVDICQRNGKKKLLWLGDKDTTLAYTPKADEMVLTVHRWFANKSCPGSWMYARMGDLASKVTTQLGGTQVETPAVTDTEKTIWDFLFGKISNAYGAAGMMGNLYAESALKPGNLQNSYEKILGMTDAEYTAAVDSGSYSNFVKDSAGYGLAQWTYWSRKQALLQFAQAAGKSIGDLQMQLDFLWKELQGYTSVLNTLKTSTTVKAASDAVLTGYERPADQSDTVKEKRAGYGQKYFDKYAGAKTDKPADTCTAAKVIAVAVEQIGYKEKASNASLDSKTANAGSANYTKYARDFDQKYPNWYNGKKNGYAWCDMFVDWCFLTAFGYKKALALLCQPERSAGAGCTYSLRYYKAKGQFHTNNPQPGDQIFFGTSLDNSTHTGIVESVDKKQVHTIEGNTSNQVARRNYSLTNSRILGYGRPAYDGAPVETPQPVTESEAVPFLVRVSITDLNIRKGPGTNYSRTGQYTGKGVFTIMEVKSGQGSTAGWGRLKSGAGWISLDYAARL